MGTVLILLVQYLEANRKRAGSANTLRKRLHDQEIVVKALEQYATVLRGGFVWLHICKLPKSLQFSADQVKTTKAEIADLAEERLALKGMFQCVVYFSRSEFTLSIQ